MSEIKTQRSLAKGLLAGLIAGLVATAAKSIAERLYPPHVDGEREPPQILAEQIAGHPLNEVASSAAGGAIHWGFGAAVGAAYGALAEYYPAATDKDGATFGLALMTLTHETALPAMGLAASVEDQSPREQTSEAASHLLYGMVAERVRSLVRGLLG